MLHTHTLTHAERMAHDAHKQGERLNINPCWDFQIDLYQQNKCMREMVLDRIEQKYCMHTHDNIIGASVTTTLPKVQNAVLWPLFIFMLNMHISLAQPFSIHSLDLFVPVWWREKKKRIVPATVRFRCKHFHSFDFRDDVSVYSFARKQLNDSPPLLAEMLWLNGKHSNRMCS